MCKKYASSVLSKSCRNTHKYSDGLQQPSQSRADVETNENNKYVQWENQFIIIGKLLIYETFKKDILKKSRDLFNTWPIWESQ